MSDELDAQFRAIAKAVMRATADPGVFCRRADNFGEALGSWEARAVNIALGPFVQQATADRDSLRATLAALQQRCDRLETALREIAQDYGSADENESCDHGTIASAAIAPDANSGATDGQGRAKP